MKLSAFAVLAIAFCVAVSAPAASAAGEHAEYTEYPCTGFEPTDAWIWDSDWNDNWGSSTECASGVPGYYIAVGADAHLGDKSEDFTIDTTYAEIRSASAIVYLVGDEPTGISVSIQACKFSICSDPVSSVADQQGGLALNFDDDSIPAGAFTLVVRAECTIAVCPAGGNVRLGNVVITRRDDTPPEFTLFEMDDNFDPLPEGVKWNNGKVRFGTVDGGQADVESLLSHFEVGIENIHLCYSLFIPEMVFPDCTMIPDQVEPEIFASELEDGHHELSFSFINRAGLTTTHSIVVKTDKTPPGQPHQFEVSPHFNGWQNDTAVTIDWANSGETSESLTQSGISGFTYDVDPKLGGSNPPTVDDDPAPVTVKEDAAHQLQLQLPGAGQWKVEIETFDRAGNVSDAGTVAINIDDAVLPAPTVDPIAPINASDLQTGRTITWTPGTPTVSGRCGYDWAFAAVAGFNPGEDAGSPLLADDPVSLSLTAAQVQALSERPQRFHLRGYSCAGVPGEIAHEPVIVDFTAPKITISPSGGTLVGSEPISIGVQDVKQGTIQSGVASVTCVLKSTPVSCANGSQLHPAGGQNHLEVTATDVAGNSSTSEADFVVDAAPPTGWIDDRLPADPTLVRATVQDADSGIKEADLEYKPVSGGEWTRFGNGIRTETAQFGAVELSARIPDDGELGDGSYLLRVRATDAANSSALISRWASGVGDADFSIPLRAGVTLSAGLTKRPSSKSDLLTLIRVDYGAMPFVVGSLKTKSGAPVAGAQLTIAADQPGTPPHTVGSVTTDANGAYSHHVSIGGSRRFVVRFGGNLVARSTSAEAQLRVRGKVTLKASRSSVSGHGQLHLRGKVFAEGAALPLIGKTVELRFKIAGRTSSSVRIRKTDSSGRFDFPFSYDAGHRPVRFSARVVATTEPTWPFDEGFSKPVKFVVKP